MPQKIPQIIALRVFINSYSKVKNLDQYEKTVELLRGKNGSFTTPQNSNPGIASTTQPHFNVLLANPQVMHNLSSFFHSSVNPSATVVEKHFKRGDSPSQIPRCNVEQHLPQLPPSVPLGVTTKVSSPPRQLSPKVSFKRNNFCFFLRRYFFIHLYKREKLLN